MAFSQHIAIARRDNVWESPPGPTEEVPEYLNGIGASWGDRNYSPLDVIIVPRLTCNLVGTGQLDFDRPYQEGDVLACWVQQDSTPIEYWFTGTIQAANYRKVSADIAVATIRAISNISLLLTLENLTFEHSSLTASIDLCTALADVMDVAGERLTVDIPTMLPAVDAPEIAGRQITNWAFGPEPWKDIIGRLLHTAYPGLSVATDGRGRVVFNSAGLPYAEYRHGFLSVTGSAPVHLRVGSVTRPDFIQPNRPRVTGLALEAIAQPENPTPIEDTTSSFPIEVRPGSRTRILVSQDGIGSADVSEILRWALVVTPSDVVFEGARVEVNGSIETDVENNDVYVNFAPQAVGGNISGLTVADADGNVSLTFTVQAHGGMGGPSIVSEVAVLPGAVSEPRPLGVFDYFPDAQETAVRILPYRYIAQSAVPDPWIYRLEKTVIPDGPDYIPPSLIPYGAILSFYIGGRRHTGRITHVDIRAESTLLRYFITVASIPLAEQYGLTDREGEELIDRGGEILLPRGHSIPPDVIEGLTLTAGTGEIDVEWDAVSQAVGRFRVTHVRVFGGIEVLSASWEAVS